jgi:LmbE family N-acetylglucosaminyl deacetylase
VRADFDHRESGTPEAAWRSAGLDALPRLRAVARRVVVLSAHPDDETLGAGGLIAACARSGAEIAVLVATDGEASHPGSPTHPPAELAMIRRRELHAALGRLAPDAQLTFLGLPDGRLSGYEHVLAAELATAVDGPATLLITPWADDGHPDHEACARAGARVAAERESQHWQFPVWAWHWADPAGTDLPRHRLRRFDLDAADSAAKRAALAEHVSQHAPLSDHPADAAILAPHVRAHFERPYECFVVDAAPAEQPDYFAALYVDNQDPWGLATRFYEQRKREVLLACLPRPRFRRGFEPGCATGLLTERLAARCDALVAWDVADEAVRQTTARVGSGAVTVRTGRIPDEWPAGSFDLIVLSEVGYYCRPVERLVDRVLDSLTPDGVVVACHWLHPAPDHPLAADAVHDAFGSALEPVVSHREADFRLDVWSRTGRSVAQVEGIV